MKKLGKQGLSEDMGRDAEVLVQELTNTYSNKINELFAAKEADIMTV